MGEVGPVVVVVEELLVRRLQFTPGGGPRGVVIRHPAHHVEVSLDEVLPRLAAVDLVA